jgi:hypothetical protein
MELKLDTEMIDNLESLSGQSLTSGDTDRVGRVFHESLLKSLLRSNPQEGTAFGVTDKRVLTCSLNYEEHDQRSDAARNAGRYFSHEAVEADETLLFIGATSVGVNHRDDSEVALTFIQDLRPMHTVTTEDEFVPAFKDSQVLLFLDELSADGKISTVNDGDICLSKDDYDALPSTERQGFTTAQNTLLFQTFIGSTYSFKYCRDKAATEAV